MRTTKTRRRGESAAPADKSSGTQITPDPQSRSLIFIFRSDFEKYGETVLAALRESDPITWLKLCVQVIPRESEPHDHPLGRISEDELAYLERLLAERLAAGPNPEGA